MDPNENLHEQLLLARELAEVGRPRPADVQRLAALVIALDEWVAKGGFIPERWATKLEQVCAACRKPIEKGAPCAEAKDGAVFHRRCWENI